MTDTLFLCERKIIQNVGLKEWGIVPMEINPTQTFHGSFATPNNLPKKRQHFNLGFEFIFYENQAFPDKTKGMAVPILPGTLGAEVFFSCEPDTMLPVYLTFMDSDKFPIKYFAHYIEEVENAIQKAIDFHNGWLPCEEQFAESFCCKRLTVKQFDGRKPLKQHKYLRVMVIYDVICFLSFPKNNLPIHQGTRYRIAEDGDRCIDCCVGDEELVCFDGWLKTSISPPSKGKMLVSTHQIVKNDMSGEPDFASETK